MNNIVDERGLLAALPALKNRQLGRLRRLGKIPHIRLGHRGILYDVDRVVEALRELEVTGKKTVATK
jgi:hypothetical protein